MSIQLASADETKLETIIGSSGIHADENKIIVLLDAKYLSDSQEKMLEEDGLFVGFNIEAPMVKTKEHIILTSQASGGSVSALREGQWLIEFDL